MNSGKIVMFQHKSNFVNSLTIRSIFFINIAHPLTTHIAGY